MANLIEFDKRSIPRYIAREIISRFGDPTFQERINLGISGAGVFVIKLPEHPSQYVLKVESGIGLREQKARQMLNGSLRLPEILLRAEDYYLQEYIRGLTIGQLVERRLTHNRSQHPLIKFVAEQDKLWWETSSHDTSSSKG